MAGDPTRRPSLREVLPHPAGGSRCRRWFHLRVGLRGRSDWVQNVLARGTAQLEIDDNVVDLADPVIIDAAEALPQLPADTKPPPRLLKINEFLRMNTVDTDPSQ